MLSVPKLAWPVQIGIVALVRPMLGFMWVVVKIMVPFWIPIIVQHLVFRVPKKGPQPPMLQRMGSVDLAWIGNETFLSRLVGH